MRRWVCLVAFVGGVVGTDYTAAARVRPPVAIERRLDDPPGSTAPVHPHALRRGDAASWWART